jgi:hypothetical protein
MGEKSLEPQPPDALIEILRRSDVAGVIKGCAVGTDKASRRSGKT